MTADRPIFLVAGGTGGHLFPAQALAEELSAKGHEVELLTDDRVRDHGKDFPTRNVHVIPSAPLSISSPMRLPPQLVRLSRGYFMSRKLLSRALPTVLVGFGGYPSLPPLLAGGHLGIPTIIHEQNAVMGRANRLLAARASLVATSFENVAGIPGKALPNVRLTGNPVRKRVLSARGRPYVPVTARGAIRIVIFGGSQGAKFFSGFLPMVLATLPAGIRRRLEITQQCRPEDISPARAAYASARISARLESFFADLPDIIAESHLVISRSGASTIAELGALERPAILVPLPGAIDNDQLQNARSFEVAGGGFVVEQKDAEREQFASLLQELIESPGRLKQAAAAAGLYGRPDAAQRLAALVQSTIVENERSGRRKNT